MKRESELVRGCLAGDPGSLTELIAKHWGDVYAAAAKARHLCGSRNHSCSPEDLADEFILKLIGNIRKILGGFDCDRGPLGSWIRKIAFHHCLNFLRSTSVRWPGRGPIRLCLNLDTIPDSIGGPPNVIAEDRVARLLIELDDESRWIVQARYGLKPFRKPLTVKEIATRLGQTQWQVYHRLREILSNLRAFNESLDDDLAGGGSDSQLKKCQGLASQNRMRTRTIRPCPVKTAQFE